MRHSEKQVPTETLEYVAKLSDHELAMHLKAYRMSSDLYALPLYLTALIHEAVKRIQTLPQETDHES